jgi:hypothetical protein
MTEDMRAKYAAINAEKAKARAEKKAKFAEVNEEGQAV